MRLEVLAVEVLVVPWVVVVGLVQRERLRRLAGCKLPAGPGAVGEPRIDIRPALQTLQAVGLVTGPEDRGAGFARVAPRQVYGANVVWKGRVAQ